AVVTNDESGYSGLTASQSGMLSLLRSAPQASLWVERSAANSFTELPGGDLTREGADGLAWLRDGRILASHVFHHDYQLWAVTPDGLHARPLPLKGPVGALLAPVATPSGSIVFLARSGGRISLWRANPDGSGSTRLTVALATGAGLGLIDNGTQVELIVAHQLWSVPVAGGDAHQLWNEPIRGLTSAASPGGRRILVFLPDPTILTLAPSGAMTTSPVALNRQTMFPPYAWTPDGRAITFIHRHGSVANVWALPVAGGPPHPLTHFTDLDIFAYTFGPHGRIALSRGRENTNLYFAHATKK
ncbi:MAG: TolB family protein, partial [Terriglobales bacterium]